MQHLKGEVGVIQVQKEGGVPLPKQYLRKVCQIRRPQEVMQCVVWRSVDPCLHSTLYIACQRQRLDCQRMDASRAAECIIA